MKLCSRVGHAPSDTNNIPLCSYYDTHMTATIDSWLSDFFRGFIVISEMGKNLLPSEIVRRPAPCYIAILNEHMSLPTLHMCIHVHDCWVRLVNVSG